MKTTVVLPTYNEAENLPLMVAALLALGIDGLHILVVDDNSPDGTGQIADDLAAQHKGQVSVLHNPGKNGLGPAYIKGFKRALNEDADYIIQMDSDFSHQPKYIPQLIAAAEAAGGGADMVLGSRWVKGGSVDQSWSAYRKLLSWFANRVYVRTLLRLPVNDATGGYRLWRRQTLIGINLDRVVSNGYVFQVEMAYITARLGFKITEIPIYFPDRVRGESKMTTQIARDAAVGCLDILRRHRNLNPQMRRREAYG